MVNDTMLHAPDPVDWSTYDDGGKKFVPLAPEGEYTVQETDAPTQGVRDGYLTFTLAPLKILDKGPGEGQEIRFADISTKKWPKRNGSSMGDYLRAKGVSLQGTPSNEQYIAAVKAVTTRPFRISVRWNGKCQVCGSYFRGAAAYPVREDGSPQSYMDCPNGCKDPSGTLIEGTDEVRPSRVFANLRVGFFKVAVPVPASQARS